MLSFLKDKSRIVSFEILRALHLSTRCQTMPCTTAENGWLILIIIIIIIIVIAFIILTMISIIIIILIIMMMKGAK